MLYLPVHYARTRISPETHSYLMCSTRTQDAVSAAANYYLHYYLLLTQTLLCFNIIYDLWLIFSDIYFQYTEPHVCPLGLLLWTLNFELFKNCNSDYFCACAYFMLVSNCKDCVVHKAAIYRSKVAWQRYTWRNYCTRDKCVIIAHVISADTHIYIYKQTWKTLSNLRTSW